MIAKYFIWLMNLIAWIWTLIDIHRSKFKNESNSKWFLFVLLIPFPAMGFYYWFGIRQKEKRTMRFTEFGKK
jgi:uncharacterized membrane protein